MQWNEYIENLLASSKEFEGVTVSLDGGRTSTRVPPIIQASIFMLDKMLENQGMLNLFVFPEIKELFPVFVLTKLCHNIAIGRISSHYDPSQFVVGEKLKVGNSIVEYRGTEERDGNICLLVKCSDLDKYSIAIDALPVFQRVSTKRRLSKYAQFADAKKEALQLASGDMSEGINISYIADMKTHMKSSVFVMTTLIKAKEQMSKMQINGRKATDVFFAGQADYQGEISNIGAGQMSGVPSVIISPDLYAIREATERGNPIQSLIVDVSDHNVTEAQLDAMDDLISLKVPIACVTDTANSFELGALSERGFNIWRWDEDSLTNRISISGYGVADKETANCARHTVSYLYAGGGEISDAMKLLSVHRTDIAGQPDRIMKLYEQLNNLTFKALRETIPDTSDDLLYANDILDKCEITLSEEKEFISVESEKDYSEVISMLRNVYSKGYKNAKNELIKERLKEFPEKDIILVIPKDAPKSDIYGYWNRWCLQHSIKAKVIVLTPKEYYSWPNTEIEETIICGWLKSTTMRKLIYSFNTPEYLVLLYDHERFWKNHHTSSWKKALSNYGNKLIVERSFSTDDEITPPDVINSSGLPDAEKEPDELAEIELVIRENRFRPFIERGKRSGSVPVPAVPVYYVGCFLAFYRKGHKVISATRIITENADSVDLRTPDELKTGDFIVVRESDKDIVREIADIILHNSGADDVREKAKKWKEAIAIELVFIDENEFCKKVIDAGCQKGMATIKHWIDDEDVIAPSSKEDLRILASVTENEMLLETLDEVFSAAQTVRKAHVQAGRKLSELLRGSLSEKLKGNGGIDPFNYWEPINMDIEGIGNIKVLKVIDLGEEIIVDSGDTNRLIKG